MSSKVSLSKYPTTPSQQFEKAPAGEVQMDEKFSELTLNGGFGDDLNVSKTKSFPSYLHYFVQMRYWI
jgi:hypothetical protein